MSICVLSFSRAYRSTVVLTSDADQDALALLRKGKKGELIKQSSSKPARPFLSALCGAEFGQEGEGVASLPPSPLSPFAAKNSGPVRDADALPAQHTPSSSSSPPPGQLCTPHTNRIRSRPVSSGFQRFTNGPRVLVYPVLSLSRRGVLVKVSRSPKAKIVPILSRSLSRACPIPLPCIQL